MNPHRPCLPPLNPLWLSGKNKSLSTPRARFLRARRGYFLQMSLLTPPHYRLCDVTPAKIIRLAMDHFRHDNPECIRV